MILGMAKDEVTKEVEGASKEVGPGIPDRGSKEELEEYFKARHGLADHRYVQLGRDQERDIAEKLGEGPHPEVANPAPPEELQKYPGVGLSAPKPNQV